MDLMGGGFSEAGGFMTETASGSNSAAKGTDKKVMRWSFLSFIYYIYE
jgi:hypothetical protein